ncbi:MAG: glycoside hydrolase family 127 protein [Fimbriimonadales bacterium]|nr:glycoside hydrolase family 127 protein [Fimbriimonadales bacterium]
MPTRQFHPISLAHVDITDSFWLKRQRTLRTATLPHLFSELERAGNIPNLRLAAERKREGYQGPVYMDSDLYKALEAAAYVLHKHPEDPVRAKVDEVIDILERAQEPDGYLNSYFQVVAPDKRWTNLRDWHELYCAGHLIEAAVAHYEATGSPRLLNIAKRFADYIDSVFGDAPNKRLGYCGHPEIELALFRLYHATGDVRYAKLASFFLLNRGKKVFAQEHNIPLEQYDGTIWQDNLPLLEQREIVGHAVRACYLFAGATDLAMETDDPVLRQQLITMLQRVWANALNRRTYITGGVGNEPKHEGFTKDYELPNRTAYQETCASVALIFWAHRMGQLFGEARYYDALERALYNGALAGISLDGMRFFYVNPLESDGSHHRQPWYGCACCPPNIARLIASLGSYIYARSKDALYVNLYIGSRLRLEWQSKPLVVELQTGYPWHESVAVRIAESASPRFKLMLRLPAWCEAPELRVNGAPVAIQRERGYAVVKRNWAPGDIVELRLPMPPVLMEAHPRVEADRWQVAIQRGPIVYCLEEHDQPAPLTHLAIRRDHPLHSRWEAELLGGVVVVEGMAEVLESDEAWGDTLYRPLRERALKPFRAIPYYAWDHRQPTPMRVWMPGV